MTPDKRTIFCTQEHLVLATLKFSLTTTWDRLQGSFTVKPVAELTFGVKRTISPTTADHPAKRLQSLRTISNVVRTEKQNIQRDGDNVQSDMTNQRKY